MQKILLLFLTVYTIQANEFDQDFNREFDKMQNFFNTVINSDIKRKYFNIQYPKIDMLETPSTHTIIFNLAGIDKKDIKLTLNDNNILKIEGEKKQKVLDTSETFTKEEIFSGKFQRSIKLPQNINPKTLKTKYENGILSVTINKKMITTSNAKIIPIN
jgi:HSP20 family protein